MKVAIVGGGITGASAASSLAGRGVEVTVFDQGGRGPGGRASHRRVDAASGTVGPDDALLAPEDDSTYEFDHGCQFFRADSPQMRAITERWVEAGWASRWEGRFGRLGRGADSRGSNDFAAAPDFFGVPGSEGPVYTGVGGMHRLPRAILAASGASVRRGVRVSSVAPAAGGGWALRGTGGLAALHDTANSIADGVDDAPLGVFDAVLLTDASQSLGGWHRASAGLAAGTGSAEAVGRVRHRVRVPLFSAIVALSHPIGEAVGLDAFTVSGGGSPLWFAARSQSKPGVPRGAAECWTLVSTADYAVRQIQETPMQSPSGAFRPQEDSYLLSEPGPALFDALLAAVAPRLAAASVPLPAAVYMHAQRWGSALPSPASVFGRDADGAHKPLGSAASEAVEVCGIRYAPRLPPLVYDPPARTIGQGPAEELRAIEGVDDGGSPDADAADAIECGGGLFYAGDFCSRRNPGFEAAALSGAAAAALLLQRRGESLEDVSRKGLGSVSRGGESASATLPRPAVATSLAAARAAADRLGEAAEAAGATRGLNLQPAGRGRFRGERARVFETAAGVRLVYQLSLRARTPILLLGGGQSGRALACTTPCGAEHAAWAGHTVLLVDRTNCGSSDVAYRGGAEVDEQAADLAELLDAIAAAAPPPWVFVGHSSGGRLLGRLAARRPDLACGLALLILTGGPAAADGIGRQYYTRHAGVARGGMDALLAQGFYAERAAANERVAETLRAMPPPAFLAAMEASARLLSDSRAEPALGLPAADLRRLGNTLPIFVCNYYGDGEHDGMHTASTSRAVAAAAGASCELVISKDVQVWLPALAAFVGRVSAEVLAA